MTKPDTRLLKTCANCGQEKPLSAFLQHVGPEGPSYGSLCASCRKTTVEDKSAEESTTSNTGVRISSKTKVHEEIGDKQLRKEYEEQSITDREEIERERFLEIEQNAKIARTEREHREQFLRTEDREEEKNQVDNASAPIFGGEEHKAKAGQIDLATGPFRTHVAGLVKHHSPFFTAHKTRLGKGTAIGSDVKTPKDAASPLFQQDPPNKSTAEKSTFGQFKNWLGKDSVIVKTLEKAGYSEHSDLTHPKKPTRRK